MPRHRNTQTPNALIPSPLARKYVYSVFLSVGPVLTFYGLASAQEFVLWAGVAATALGLPSGLALVNTPGGTS